MSPEDKELMAEIQSYADKAEEKAPDVYDALALATTLAQRFEHRSVDEIREKIKDVFRARGLYWAG